jgi:hypothetical protein
MRRCFQGVSLRDDLGEHSSSTVFRNLGGDRLVLTAPEKEDTGVPSENIFSIVDRLVYQIDRTKKLILGMIIAIIVAIPVSWHVSPLLLGTPYGYSFRLAGIITILIAALFFVIGARQWILLSNWTRRYKAYKEAQKRIDEKLDFEDGKEKR